MNSGAVFGIVLTLSLFVFNYFPYTLKEKFRLPYWVSGILICFLGPLVAMGVGSYLLDEAHREGSDGFGAGIAGAIIAIVLIANGALYIIGSVVSAIEQYVTRRKKEKTHN
ncbi:hypothetical protein ACQCVB_14520 [Fictibacillus phosphorivorans]|uniref:hypothetical protein n=1 Tax=Fictibacillus TaxID=1329200 RepID=UPI0018CEF55F|nr:hypothetical protein [Fictibacillus sp. 23RED33]MBH0172503.1 hypothetical protein [Fictibacillus sp. 23RED33]